MKPKKLSPQEEAEITARIVRLYVEDEMTLQQIKGAIGRSLSFITNRLKAAGVRIRKKGQTHSYALMQRALAYAREHGRQATLDHFGLASTTFDAWVVRADEYGITPLVERTEAEMATITRLAGGGRLLRTSTRQNQVRWLVLTPDGTPEPVDADVAYLLTTETEDNDPPLVQVARDAWEHPAAVRRGLARTQRAA